MSNISSLDLMYAELQRREIVCQDIMDRLEEYEKNLAELHSKVIIYTNTVDNAVNEAIATCSNITAKFTTNKVINEDEIKRDIAQLLFRLTKSTGDGYSTSWASTAATNSKFLSIGDMLNVTSKTLRSITDQMRSVLQIKNSELTKLQRELSDRRNELLSVQSQLVLDRLTMYENYIFNDDDVRNEE